MFRHCLLNFLDKLISSQVKENTISLNKIIKTVNVKICSFCIILFLKHRCNGLLISQSRSTLSPLFRYKLLMHFWNVIQSVPVNIRKGIFVGFFNMAFRIVQNDFFSSFLLLVAKTFDFLETSWSFCQAEILNQLWKNFLVCFHPKKVSIKPRATAYNAAIERYLVRFRTESVIEMPCNERRK